MKRALLAGVDEYERFSGISPLKYGARDAVVLGALLRDVCQFDQVQVLAGDQEGSEGHATRNAISDRVKHAIEDLRPDDLFLLAFFMHGVTVEVEGTRREFLLTRDARLDEVETYLEHAMITRRLQRMQARRRVLILDCCRNDPDAARGEAARPLGTDLARDLSLASAKARGGAPATTGVLTACSIGERAYESDRHGHGVFAYHLLQGIRQDAWEDGVLDIRSVARHVTASVHAGEAQQTPTFRQEGAEPIILAFRKIQAAPVPVPQRAPVDVENFVIGPIDVDPGKVEATSIPAAEAGVPALDVDLRDVQAHILGLDQAIAGLESGTHTSLDSSRRQIAEAAAQMRRLEADRDTLWRRLAPGSDLPRTLMTSFEHDPAAVSLFEAVRDPTLAPVADYTDRMDVLHAIRNAQQARRNHDEAAASLESMRHGKVAALAAERTWLLSSLRQSLERWFATVAEAQERPVDAAFPVERYIGLMRNVAPQLPSIASETLWDIARSGYDADSARRERAAAERRDVSAQIRLADSYRVGRGVGPSPEAAVRLYRFAAEQGHVVASARLADMLHAGRGAARDDAEAARLYRFAAERGDAWSRLNLGFMYAHGLGVELDPAQALQHYLVVANGGDAMARFLLGRLRASSIDVGPSAAETLQLYRLAAGNGLPAAQNELGILHYRGAGAERDDLEARRWFGLAATDGLAVAQVNLGLMHFASGEHAEAARQFRLAAEQGHAAAQNNLGVMLGDGLGVKADKAEAGRLLLLAHRQSVAPAWANLAALKWPRRQETASDYGRRLIGLGRGFQQDELEAMRLHRLAFDRAIAAAPSAAGETSADAPGAAAGNPQRREPAGRVSQPLRSLPPPLPPRAEARSRRRPGRAFKVAIALLLVVGAAALLVPRGEAPIPRDSAAPTAAPAAAAVCSNFGAADVATLRACAETGDAVGQAFLANAYLSGEGVAQDYAEAARLLHLSAAQGYAFGQTSLGRLYQYGYAVDQDYAEAARLYRLAADQGDSFGQFYLAGLYLGGLGVPSDPAAAVRLYRSAADKDNPFAQCALSALYRDGTGVPKDSTEADRLHALAAAGGAAISCPAR